MTDYTIEIGKTLLELSYTKSGKLKNMKAKLGFIDPGVVSELVPANEEAMIHMVNNSMWAKKVTIEKDHFFSIAQSDWMAFFKNRAGLSYRFTPADGKALKNIGKHLTEVSGDTAKALESWRFILLKWDSLDPFYRNKPELPFINSQINTILNLMKNGKQTSEAANKSAADDLRRRFQS